MKNFNWIACICVTLIAATPCAAQTYLNGGNLSTPLTKAKSPYIVTSTVTVPETIVLTIEPGVTILFNDGMQLLVNGVVKALGTAQNPIVFSASDTSLGWDGIEIFKNTTLTETNTFEHCTFSYTYRLKRNSLDNHGAILLDTVNDTRFTKCNFVNNTSLLSSAIRAAYSNNTIVENCLFESNCATDTGNFKPLSSEGPVASCIFGFHSDFFIKSSTFKNNQTNAPRYPGSSVPGEEKAAYMLWFFGNKVSLLNCVFENNHSDAKGLVQYDGGWRPELKKDSFLVENCQFLKNSTASGSILSLNGSDREKVSFKVNRSTFSENFSTNEGVRGEIIFCYNNFGSQNSYEIDHCILKNNFTSVGIYIHQDAPVTLSNSLVYGQKGKGVVVRGTKQAIIVNSIINNNWIGIESAFNGELGLLNSVVAYNGRIDTSRPYPTAFPTGEPSYFSGGIMITNRGQINIGNSIITHNKNFQGDQGNLFGITNRTVWPGLLTNSLLEGGTDSTYRHSIINGTYTKSDSVAFSSIKNLLTESIVFVNPPKGIGVEYTSDDIDFHIKRSCDSSLFFNAGLNFVPGHSLSSWPEGKDLDGNPRIQCSTMDIGPYEFTGPTNYTYIESDWRDTNLCTNNLSAFNPQICGEDVNYFWQYASDNSLWKPLDSKEFKGKELINPTDGYYRVIASQKLCNTLDTFGSAKLTTLKTPNPNLGEDRILYKQDSLWLTPGDGFSSYLWNLPGGDTSHKQLLGPRSPSFGSRYIWCEVTAANGCSARDSLLIYFRDKTNDIAETDLVDWNAYPNPTNGVLTLLFPVDFSPECISVLNSVGTTVQSIYPKNSSRGVTLDLNSLPSGVYTLLVRSNQHKIQRKIVLNQTN